MSFTRRSMLKATIAGLPAYWAARVLGWRMPVAPGAAGSAPVDAARAFLANQVRLLPGSPFYARQELHRKGVLASYDPDKLLYPYRALAKLPQREGIQRLMTEARSRLGQNENRAPPFTTRPSSGAQASTVQRPSASRFGADHINRHPSTSHWPSGNFAKVPVNGIPLMMQLK